MTVEYTCPHPNQIKSIKTQKNGVIKVLSVENNLAPASEKPRAGTKNEEMGFVQSPCELFADYAGFGITLIVCDHTDGKKSTHTITAHIPAEDLAMIELNSKYAQYKVMEERIKPSTKNKDSIPSAYTVRLKVGKKHGFVGKTPAQVLQIPENRTLLEEDMLWLENRLDSFQGNTEQYQAIKQALSLLDAGQLCDSVTTENAGTEIPILDNDYRPVLSSKRDSDGRCRIYSIKIVCRPEQTKMPYVIKITNRWSICNGIQEKEGTAVEYVEDEINITEGKYLDLIDKMKSYKEMYVRLYGKYELERAYSFVQKARQEC